MRVLLELGARQELQDNNGRAALHLAAFQDHAGAVALLCSAPGAAAALALRDADGRTPHAIAAFFGHDDVDARLRTHGAL